MQPYGFFEGSGLDVSYRGRLNKYFTGFGRYTWSHYESNTGGIGWFLDNEYGALNPPSCSTSVLTGATGLGCTQCSIPRASTILLRALSANTGRPWTITTGTRILHGDSLFNTRPDGVARNTETAPSVRRSAPASRDMTSPITLNKDDDAPRVGFSAGAFNLLNHQNPLQHRARAEFLAHFRRSDRRRAAAADSAGYARGSEPENVSLVMQLSRPSRVESRSEERHASNACFLPCCCSLHFLSQPRPRTRTRTPCSSAAISWCPKANQCTTPSASSAASTPKATSTTT